MEITENQIENFIKIVSKDRLDSYKLTDSYKLLLARYIFNIKISETFYPILSALEIALRNNIYNAVCNIKGKNWLINEINSQSILSINERNLLIESYNKLSKKHYGKTITESGLIAELTFGFWVNLCKKSYKNSFWDKQNFFGNVFPDFDNYFTSPTWDKTKVIFPELKNILILRNRIFHHEIIINNKNGIENMYDKVERVLYSLSTDYADLFKDSFRFKEIIMQKP